MPTKKHVKVTVAVILSLVLVIVVLQNTETVETRLLFITVAMPRAVLLFVAFVVGLVIGMIVVTRFTSTKPKQEPKD